MPQTPTVEHVRNVLTAAAKNFARWPRPRPRVVDGVANTRAVDLLRQALKRRAATDPVSLFVWKTAKALADTAPQTGHLWWNEHGWP